MNTKKTIIYNILRHLFGGLATLGTSMLVICAGLLLTLALGRLDNVTQQVDYYTHAYNEMVNDLKALAPASGVSEQFFETVIDKEQMKQHTIAYMNSRKNGADSNFECESETKVQIYSKLCKYAEDEGYVLTDSVKNELDHLAALCTDKYVEHTCKKTLGTAYKYINMFLPRLIKLLTVAVAILFVFCVFCNVYAMHLQVKSQILLLSTGICVILPVTLVIRLAMHLNISSYSVHSLINGYVGKAFAPVLVVGVLFVVLSIIMFLLKERTKNEKNHISYPCDRNIT